LTNHSILRYTPAMKLKAINQYPPQLILDLALGIDDTYSVLERYDITPEQYDTFMLNPTFRGQLLQTQRQVAEEGAAFKLKAKLFSESHLQTMDDMMNDITTPPATKLGIWQTATKLAGLEPIKEKDSGAQQQTFQLQIIL